MSHDVLEDLSEEIYAEEEYVPDVSAALEVLIKKNPKVAEAVRKIEEDKIDEAIEELRNLGFEDDQIALILGTKLNRSLSEAYDIIHDVDARKLKSGKSLEVLLERTIRVMEPISTISILHTRRFPYTFPYTRRGEITYAKELTKEFLMRGKEPQLVVSFHRSVASA